MQSPLETFVFIDQLTKKVVSLDRVGDVALYLIDVEMEKHVSKLDSNYKKAFKIREIIPGGSFCMMSAVSALKEIFLMISPFFHHDLLFSSPSPPGLSWDLICI